MRLEQHTPSIVEYYTVRRPQKGSNLPLEKMLPNTRVMLLALLSAADNSKLSDAIDLVEKNNHRWPVKRALPGPPPTRASLSSPAEELGMPNCVRIEQALFCTTKCILGVVTGRPMDADCPNKHGHQHVSAADFREALHEQLTRSSSGHQHLWLGWSGSTSSLFKVRLASLGYVIVAKATAIRRLLEDEEYIYNEYLLPAQEIGVVPPCLGIIDLLIPRLWEDYMSGFKFSSCLLLGCVPGQPILNVAPLLTRSSPSASSTTDPDDGHASLPHQQEPPKQPLAAACRASIQTAFEVIHRLGVLHGDAALRNIIILPRGQVVLVDFENAMLCHEWLARVQQKRARKRRHRKQARLQQQDASIADQQAEFQAACRREMLRCLDELESICI